MSLKSAVGTFRGNHVPHIQFIRRTRLWFGISAAAILLSLIGLIGPGLNFSIAFTGGAQLQFPNQSGATVGDYQAIMDRFDLPSEVEIVAGNQVVIRTESLVSTQPEPSASPSVTASGSPTASPSATGSASPTASPSSTTSPTASPSEGPTPTPQPSASATSGAGAGASPSASGTPSASATPTPTPAPSPTSTTPTSRETVLLLNALAEEAGIQPEDISVTDVGPTWGGTISRKALIGLIVFLLLVSVYISLRFEPKMAISALVAVGHDLIITAGVYALTGRQVSPETVVAILTILGYSLYDTVVIFDKIKENTESVALVSRETYSGVVDISLNQTLMRSVNTSLVVLLPIGALLLIGGETLKDFAFALFVGVASGTYSSIFVASPLLALLKEREPRYQQIRARVESKGRPSLRVVGSSAAAVPSAPVADNGELEPAASPARTGTMTAPSRPRPPGSGGGSRKKKGKPQGRPKPRRR
jgi:preprotein translocase subunit SecF